MNKDIKLDFNNLSKCGVKRVKCSPKIYQKYKKLFHEKNFVWVAFDSVFFNNVNRDVEWVKVPCNIKIENETNVYVEIPQLLNLDETIPDLLS
jgi:hypothetical protein